MTPLFWYDLVILLGTKALLTGVGVVLIVVGSWCADRAWDATTDSSKTSTRDDEEAYHNMTDKNESTDTRPFYETLSLYDFYDTSTNMAVYNKVCGLGWILWTVGLALDETRYGFVVVTTLVTVVGMIVSIILGILGCVVVPKALKAHQVSRYQKPLVAFHLFGWILLGVLLAVDTTPQERQVAWMAVVGTLSIAVSPLVLWYERHYHDTPKQQRPSTFSLGGPLLVWGWLAVWVAVNATWAQPTVWFVPIFVYSKTVLAWLGAMAVFGTVWMAAYAQEHYSPVAHDGTLVEQQEQDLIQPYGLGMWGYFCLGTPTTKFVLLAAWILWATAPIIPLYAASFAEWCLAVGMIVQGVVWTLMYARAADPVRVTRLARVALVSAALWWIVLAINNFKTAVVAAVGILAMASGWYVLQQDHEINDSLVAAADEQVTTAGENKKKQVTVYSMGTLLVSVAFWLLAYVVSVPV